MLWCVYLFFLLGNTFFLYAFHSLVYTRRSFRSASILSFSRFFFSDLFIPVCLSLSSLLASALPFYMYSYRVANICLSLSYSLCSSHSSSGASSPASPLSLFLSLSLSFLRAIVQFPCFLPSALFINLFLFLTFHTFFLLF